MSKTSTSTTEPSKFAKPYLTNAASTLQDSYSLNAPKIGALTDTVTGLAPGLVQRFTEGDPGVNAAKGYNTDVLSGRFLDEGNPYLQQILQQTGDQIRNQTQAALGVRGLTGGSTYADLISKNIGENAARLLYGNYSAERDRMGQAAGMAGNIASADYLPLNSLLNVQSASTLPLQAAGSYAGGIGNLLGQYSTTKQKTPMLPGIIGAGLSGWASGGFKGL